MKPGPDYARSQGGAALGARLRRLSERIDREVTGIYAEQGLVFEQRWFGVLNQLVINGPMTVTDIAAALRISHVSVSQASGSLIRAGYLDPVPDKEDARRRLLILSASGEALVERLALLWQALDAAAEKLDAEAGGVVSLLDRLEDALDATALRDRTAAEIASRSR